MLKPHEQREIVRAAIRLGTTRQHLAVRRRKEEISERTYLASLNKAKEAFADMLKEVG